MSVRTILGFVILSFSFVAGCGLTPPDPPPPENPYWDTDGDGISNATENNDANSHHGFDPDVPNANPSAAIGTPINGSLQGGINLLNSGEGYYHPNPAIRILDKKLTAFVRRRSMFLLCSHQKTV